MSFEEVMRTSARKADWTQINGDYLPMAVHVKAGWTEEQVRAYDDWREDSKIGIMWRVGVVGKGSRQTFSTDQPWL